MAAEPQGRRAAAGALALHRRRVVLRRRVDRIGYFAALVVAHQHDLAIAAASTARQHRHAIVVARAGRAVVERIAGPRVTAIAEARRQLQQRQAGCEVARRTRRAVRTDLGARRDGAVRIVQPQQLGEGGGAGKGAGTQEASP